MSNPVDQSLAEHAPHPIPLGSLWDRLDYQPPTALRTPDGPARVPPRRFDLRPALTIDAATLKRCRTIVPPGVALGTTPGGYPQAPAKGAGERFQDAISRQVARIADGNRAKRERRRRLNAALAPVADQAPAPAPRRGTNAARVLTNTARVLAALAAAAPGDGYTLRTLAERTGLTVHQVNSVTKTGLAQRTLEIRVLSGAHGRSGQYRVVQAAPWPAPPEGYRLPAADPAGIKGHVVRSARVSRARVAAAARRVHQTTGSQS